MQRADADVESEFGPQSLQSKIGLFSDGCSQDGFVATMERQLFGERRSSGDFTGSLIATNELANPLGTDRVLATKVSELHATLEVLQHPFTQIDRVRFHL